MEDAQTDPVEEMVSLGAYARLVDAKALGS